MDKSDRVELAAARAGFKSISALARALDKSPQEIQAFTSGGRPMRELVLQIADKTGVSEHWLRSGLEADAPAWAVEIYALERELTVAERAITTVTDPRLLAQAQDTALRIRAQLEQILKRRKAEPARLVSTLAVEPGTGGLKARAAQLELQLAEVTAERDQLRATIADLTQRLLRGERLQAVDDPAPARAAAPRSRYRIGQHQPKPEHVKSHADDK